MDMLLILSASYFGIGAIVVLVFELTTKRISNKFTTATVETQNRLASSGQFVSSRLAKILLILAIWTAWPALIAGAVSSRNEEGQENGKS